MGRTSYIVRLSLSCPCRPDLLNTAGEVLMSWDMGKCWQAVALTEAIFVDNIRCVAGGLRPKTGRAMNEA